MTAKEYLSQIKTLNIRIKSKMQQVQSIGDSLLNVSPVLSDMPRPATPNINRMAELVAVKVDLEREIEADSRKLAEITRTINSLPDETHILIITQRHFGRLEWKDIASELCFSERRIYQLYRDALNEMEKFAVGFS